MPAHPLEYSKAYVVEKPTAVWVDENKAKGTERPLFPTEIWEGRLWM